ncbi:MAG TPA: aminopeptidase P family protein [Rhodospirillaceae bacterium]|nr:aminopeptidase P family protein [Rhodospirillaceae bacterium]HIJ44582.1 aminopeptidase P family protein [Rhodospirillaceae bacterium]
MNETYSGDERLDRLLREAGSAWRAAAVRDLARGVAAAPRGVEPGAWMALIGEAIGDKLACQLAALHAETSLSFSSGLEGAGDAARLGALRAEMKRLALDGFIVPRFDEHQNEYVPLRAERLAWLTGFTGSAGQAVVLSDRAAIFVDGRYTLQARAEVDGDLFELRQLPDETPGNWIGEHFSVPGGRLGYDPWLHTPNQLRRLRAACKKAGAKLAAAAENPVDAVWSGQPPPPISPIVAHDDAVAGMASAAKRRQLGESLGQRKLAVAVLTAPDSIAWLLNIRGGDVPFAPLPLAFALIHADGCVDLFVDPRKLTAGVRRHLGGEVRLHGPDAFGPALDRLGEAGKAVCLDADGAPDWVFRRLRDSGADLSPGADPCLLPKAKKNPVELAGMRAAHRRDGAKLCCFLAWLSVAAPAGAVTETTAAQRLESLRRENDRFRGLSFATISASGPNGAIVHYRVSEKTNRRLRPGSLYLVDSGAHYLDGTTDVTRTLAIGEPTEEMSDRFTRVLKGHIAMATSRFPKGTTGSQLDSLARRALWEAGLDYDHGTGHGVGCYLSVHEGPQRISKHPSKVALEAGMVVSNEPGYYKAGAYGIRIENLLAVTAAPAPAGAERELLGFEALTLAPIDLNLVEASMLTAEEIAWLDAYHARVGDELAPLVDEKTLAWLKKATRAVGSTK